MDYQQRYYSEIKNTNKVFAVWLATKQMTKKVILDLWAHLELARVNSWSDNLSLCNDLLPKISTKYLNEILKYCSYDF